MTSKLTISKITPGSAVAHSNMLAVAKGNYCVLLSVSATPTQDLPKRERLSFKRLPLLSVFLLDKHTHQKVSERGYVTLHNLKHQKAGKDLLVTPLDAQVEVVGVSEFVVTPPTEKDLARAEKQLAKQQVAKEPKAVRKAHAKVVVANQKALKAEIKLKTVLEKKATKSAVLPPHTVK
jgi:hypothetical protein